MTMVAPGARAPDFDLPLVNGDNRVRLTDYLERAPLLLALLRSFECPFCRRNLAALAYTAKELDTQGVETLAVTTTSIAAARLYTKYRKPGLPLAADPTLGIHRRYGVPIYRFSKDQPTAWPEVLNVADFGRTLLKDSDDFSEPVTVLEAGKRIDAEDGFKAQDASEEGPPDDVSPLISYFLIDRSGIVRWTHVVAQDDFSAYAQHPSHAELIASSELLPR